MLFTHFSCPHVLYHSAYLPKTVSISVIQSGGLGNFNPHLGVWKNTNSNIVPYSDWGDLIFLAFRCWGEKVFWKVRWGVTNNFDHMDGGGGKTFFTMLKGGKEFFHIAFEIPQLTLQLYIASSLIRHYFVLLK